MERAVKRGSNELLIPGLVLLTMAAVAWFSGCAPAIGPTISVPKIEVSVPAGDAQQYARVAVAVGPVRDARTSMQGHRQNQGYTEPQGEVRREIERALTEALEMRGFSVKEGAPLAVTGTVKKWRTQLGARTTVSLASEAEIDLAVTDHSGKALYSASYSGSRSSEAPFASEVDIRNSLAQAMSEAIARFGEDDRMLETLRTR